MRKIYYKAIMLVLASDTAPIYREFRKIYQAYLNTHPDIKVFLVYGNEYSFVPRPNDLIYNVEENYYPGMITKTIEAMEYVENKYDYDYLIRTNLSTFWDFNRLTLRLDKQPNVDCFTGTLRACTYNDIESPHYIAGVDLILSRNLVKQLIQQKEEVCGWDLPEDWALSQFFLNKGISPRPSQPGAIHLMEHCTDADEYKIKEEISKAKLMGHDHFRVKSKNNRADIDLSISKILLKEYYGKTIL